MSASRPPDQVFCLECGPDVSLLVEADVLRCARCGAVQRLPGLPLFAVTGASGTGKSTIVEPLRERLPDHVILDVDVILHVAELGWKTWRNTWLQLAHALALNGRSTVLCGSLVPDQLDVLPARQLIGPIHFCNLDLPDEVLAERLRSRPAWRESSSNEYVAEHQQFAAWLRTHIEPTFDTSRLDPTSVADRVATWIQRLGR